MRRGWISGFRWAFFNHAEATCGAGFDLFDPENKAYFDLLRERKTEISNKDLLVTGFNIGLNSGESAGQTIFHCHWHLIPRRQGDVSNPRGGVRHIIPGKGCY